MSKYTAEEYRDVLKAIYDMSTEEREKVFGVSKFIPGYIEEFSVSELIEKYHAYNNLPKVGEYWKRKENNGMVIVRSVEKDTVFIYYCNNGCDNQFSLTYFIKNFIRTEHKSQYLKSFIEEMKEISK